MIPKHAVSHPTPDLQALVADDDDDVRILMSLALRRAGFEVREASNGTELVACFRAHATSRTIVVSDIGMPECNGLDATIAVKKLDPLAMVVLVTAFVSPTLLADAQRAGATLVLSKPLDFTALARTAHSLLTPR